MNLGSSGDVLSRESSISVNAIRQPLIVREEGKQPMHYVSDSMTYSFKADFNIDVILLANW
jgi:hypothetical protein